MESDENHSQTKDMAPCLFPTLNSDSPQDEESRCVAVALCSDILTERHGIKLLQAAWGIVLRSYTGVDRPTFLYRHDIGFSHDWLYATLDLTEDSEVMIAAENLITRKADQSTDDRFNTAVVAYSGGRDASQAERRFALSLEACHTGTNWTVSLQYRTSVLNQGQANAIGSLLTHVVNQIVTGPVRLSAIDLCTDDVVEKLTAWNGKEPQTIHRCIHDLVLENCKAHPDSPAICAWDGDFSYRDVDHLTAVLSDELFSNGVRAETFVGIYSDASKWTVIQMLAVLRAGGAFTLLDTSLPAYRLSNMCKMLQVRLILSSRERLEEASALNAAVVISVDQHLITRLLASSSTSQGLSSTPAKPDTAAFAVFTSGSTGTPKGIVFNHYSFCSGQSAAITTIGYGPGMRCLQFASFSFDVCVQEHLTPLMAGGCVCIPSQDARKSKLDEALRQMKVNLVVLTPTVARLLRTAEMESVKKMVLVGERLVESDVATWAGRLQLFNGYGPAECCIFSTLHSFRDDHRHHLGPNIIGSGAGALCWVVDPSDRNKLAPIGAVGELLIQGPIVGRGYVGDRDQTSSRFIPAPAWRSRFPGKDSVMYCSGDLVQYVGDGLLRYIGRRDSQVKVHGQRLELGEVERGLLDVLPIGCQALVSVISPADKSSPILTGFILCPETIYRPPCLDDIFAHPTPEFRRLADRVQTQLANRLSPYMIPPALVPLKTIPTTRTGKSDRRRLAALASKFTRRELYSFSRDSVQRQLPTSEKEKLLHEAVQQILQIHDFGMGDDFFSLGGDSVSAMRLTRQVRENTGLEISVENMLKCVTLSELASTMCPGKETADDIPPFSLLSNTESLQETLRKAASCCRLPSADDIEDIYPCTALQEGITALSISSPEAKYVTCSTYRLPRVIDVDRLKQAWDVVIASNPVLRTRIVQSPTGQTLQAVLKAGFEWDSIGDLDDLKRLRAQWRVELGGRLLRLSVIRSTQGNFLSVFISHALYDGWSLPEVLKQVEEAYYDGNVASKPFKYFVRHLAQSDESQARGFWERSLEDFSAQPFPGAPTGQVKYRPAAVQTLKRSFSIPDTRSLDSALSNSILLSWAMTVSQYTGSEDVCFGTTLSGRNAPVSGIDSILGPTIATFPLRIQLDRSQTVKQALSSLQGWIQESIPFQQLGTQRIASIGPEAAAACQFQNHLVVQPPSSNETSTIFTNGDTWEVVDNYVLSLQVTLPEPGFKDLRLEATYDDKIVSPWRMNMIADQFRHNVLQVLSNSANTFHDLQSLDDAGRRVILSWNRRLQVAVNCCVHDLIGRICLGQSENMAVEAFDGSLTYGQLNAQTDKFAAHLQSLKVGPGAYIMVMLERSLRAVITMIAIMKTGAAFVMVDLSTPNSRLEQIRDDTKPVLAITSPQHAARAADLGLQPVDAHPNSTGEEVEFKRPLISHEDTVYAVFTSGSTGRPKGIAVPHRALATAATVSGDAFNLSSSSRALHASSYAFDASIGEIVYTLVQGGCICIPSETDSRDCLEDVINRFQVNYASLTPSLTRALTPSKMPTLRTMVFGGEAVTRTDIEMWPERVQLINGYGPAECTIDATFQHNVSLDNPSNIGYGAATVTWIVEPEDPTCSRLVPLGAVGELVIEGPVLAKGYLNNAAKTASSFVDYPDWLRRLRRGKLGRLYRTGDLVQYSSTGDGSLLYIGRKDNQVKLRGQRLELEEVEQHLMEVLPSATAVVAEIIKPCDAGAAPALAAFVLLDESRDGGDEILAAADSPICAQLGVAEARMMSRVPRFMVPSLFLPLNRIPMSPSGKANRRLLRETASALSRKKLKEYSSSALQPRAPLSLKEEVLQGGVCHVLRLPVNEVGMNSNFFQLGGDSISAMKLAGKVVDAGFSLSVANVFSHPTLESLASSLEQQVDKSIDSILPFELLHEAQRHDMIREAAQECRVDVERIQDIYPCTPMQEGLLSLTMKQPGQYVAELEFDLPRQVDLDRVKAAWSAVYDANSILRTRIISPRSSSGSSLQAVVDEPLAWASTFDPLVVEHGKPLLKAIISEQDNKLHIWIHHALYDGVSLPLLFEQAEAAYHGASLPLKSFNAFAAYIDKIDVKASRRFWAKEFEDLDTVMFPPRRLSPPVLPAKRMSTSWDMSVPDTQGLEFTLPSVIQAACAATMGHFANTRDVVYGLTLTGRNAPVADIGQLVGPTITTVPFRVRLKSSMLVRGLLSSVQENLVSIMPYEQTGLQTIRSFSPDCAVACDFQCTLVIQPSDETGVKNNKIFQEPKTSSNMLSLFSSSPLSLEFTISADRRSIQLLADFDDSCLDTTDVMRFSRHMERVIQQMILYSDTQIIELQEAGPHDILQLEQTNGSFKPMVDRLVHDLVLEQCRLRPTAEAICSLEVSWTYAEIEDASSRLSQHLMSISTGSVTAICMERSPWFIVAILSVLKSGSACAMLDDLHAEDMLTQTGTTLILASPETQSMVERIAVGSGARVIVISPVLLFSLPPSPPHSPKAIHSSDPAFIVSASCGSSISVTHTGIATGLAYLCPSHGLDDDSRVLHCSSPVTRSGLFEILACLTVGGCLCIPSTPERLEDLMESCRVNWAAMVSSMTHTVDPQLVPSLKTLVMTSEAVRSSDIHRWASRKDVRLFSSYGLAKCPMIGAVGQIIPGNSWNFGLIGPFVSGIGWVVTRDDSSKLCAVGAVGELLIESSVDDGFMRQGDDRMSISSPPWLARIRGHNGSRLYRTGDLVRYRDDMHVQYVGRRDRDLKLGGHRVHIEEIEAVLTLQMPVDAVVIVELVASSSAARPRLFAFVLLSRREEMNDSEELFTEPTNEFVTVCSNLKHNVNESLPRDMMPAAFIPLTHVPRTSSGKINRRLLRDEAAKLRLSDSDHSNQQPCRTMSEAESVTAELWAETLGLPKEDICAIDNFFHVGGDSIMAMKLVAAARGRGLTITVPEIFAHPRLQDMALAVKKAKPSCSSHVSVEPLSLIPEEERESLFRAVEKHCHVSREKIEDCYPCTPLQEALFSQSMRSAGDYTARFRYKVATGTDLSRFRLAWNQVIRHNPTLRARVVSTSTRMYQVVLLEQVSWEVVELGNFELLPSQLQTEDIRLGCPLLRLLLSQPGEGDDEAEFCLVIHHALYDGWSLQLLLNQVQQAYDQQSFTSQPFNQFIDYISKQDQEAVRSYWQSQLSGADGVVVFPSLPTSEYKPQADAAIRQEVKLTPLADVTRATTLELAWAVVVSQYCDSGEASYGLVLSGRNAGVEGIESMTGPTIATIPVLLKLQKDEMVIRGLRKLQVQRAAASPFEHFGLQNIRRLSRQAEAACQFQSLLLIQQLPPEEPFSLFTPVEEKDHVGNFSSHALEITCEVSGDECVVEFDFDSGVLDERQAKRLLAQYVHAIEQVQTRSGDRMRDLTLLAPSVREEILEWNKMPSSSTDICCACRDRTDTEGRHAHRLVSWIVDSEDYKVLLPIGAIGDLLLEGDATACQQLKEKAMSVIKDNPSWLRDLRPGGTLFKTGDLVQYNSDGSIRHCGRKKTHAKVRGQRDDLAEMEHQVLVASQSVSDVIAEVINSRDEEVGQVLAIFTLKTVFESNGIKEGSWLLPPTQEHREESQQLFELLKERLPMHMVPEVIIPLVRRPHSVDDRQQLIAEAAALTGEQIKQYQPSLSSAKKRAPNSETQKILQLVFAEVLGLDCDDVGVDDSFFRLGGDSIIAIRLVEQARAKGFTFRVSDVFQTPKLSDLARHLAQTDSALERNGSTASSERLLCQVDKGDVMKKLATDGLSYPDEDVHEILPVTQAAERYLFQTPEYWIINLRGSVKLERLERACSALVERHGILRTIFISRQDKFLQLVLKQMKTSIKYFQTGKTIAKFVDHYRHNDLVEIPTLATPLTDFFYVQSTGDKDANQALVIRLSHAQFDGYCLPTLWRDLTHLYEGIPVTDAIPYSLHMQQWSRGYTHEDGFSFWRETLAGSSIARIDNATFSNTPPISLEDSEFVTSSRVVHIGKALPYDMTAATVVKVAWAVLLARLSGTTDCVFAQASNGRNYDMAKEVVGMCLNFVPVRARIKADETVKELVDFIQRQHHESLAFELIDFRDIVNRSTPWEKGIKHQSVVLHQNLDPDEVFQFGDAEAWVTCSYEWPHPPDDILVESFPKENGDVQMTMDTRSNVLSQENADAVMGVLCRLIDMIARGDSQARVEMLLKAVDEAF
ncbi:hypothetical protein CP533_0494 [Ophiocordyceps camponoti-saundersi (nom. inval.)]|nr:hypothetical protein CP533_0494 [Ophiocordyceps camponoti-saundersi (nom. inval.)]